jgi:DNA-binding NtrC family response regulator
VTDELCELSPEAQASRVHMLDIPTLRASGVSGTRVIATTQFAIDHAIRAGMLRVDLYYVLGVISIAVPPLRNRFEDIPVLVAAFLARAPRRPVKITSAALAWLAGEAWPGNVRELESTIERAVALSDGGVIDVEDVAGLEGAAHSVVTLPSLRGRRSYRR